MTTNPDLRYGMMYFGVESYDGDIHLLHDDPIARIQQHEPNFECWCEPEFIGMNEDGDQKIWDHRRVQ